MPTTGKGETMFKVGEKVVYPAHGVGVIQSIQTKVVSGTEKTFYMLRILDSDMTIMIPTENVATVGLRRVIGKEMVTKVYKILREKRVEIDQQTWNRRYREYTEKIKTGAVREIPKVLRDLDAALSGVRGEDQDGVGAGDRQSAARPLRAEGGQGAVLRRTQDARYGAQPARQRALHCSGASRGEDHGRAQEYLRPL